jgi:DtxR family Mn-dependent transcriptional regulator
MTKFSQAIEDYLKQVYLLEERGVEPTGKALAERLDVSPASVTGMLKRLAELQLVEYEPYQPIRLTLTGRAIALEVVRHHRLLEAYLAEVLGMEWHEVHAEAEVLEHHISERMEALIAERLGHPDFDPHGHPIPSLDGTLPAAREDVSLVEAEPDTDVDVAVVRDDREAVLVYLGERGIVPGARLHVVERSEVAGTVTVSVAGTGDHHVLGSELAAAIDVVPARTEVRR